MTYLPPIIYTTLNRKWGWRCRYCPAESRYNYTDRDKAERLALRHRCQRQMAKTTTKTATRLFRKPQGERGKMRFYKLDPPLPGDEYVEGPIEYVIVSAVIAPLTGPETYIFKADADGEITNWGELEGSYRGGLDHDVVLKSLGYTVVQ